MEARTPAPDDPQYDAFVVRLWCNATSQRVVRAEVEHVRTGALTRAANVPAEWILSQIVTHLQDTRQGEANLAEESPARNHTCPTSQREPSEQGRRARP
jgi:hypothetical protein